MLEIPKSRDTIQKYALRMGKGDMHAAEQVYRMLVKQTYGFYFSRVRDKARAEDLTQDLFMRLVRSISQYDASKGDFVVWYWKMARNMLIDYFRKNKDAVTHDIEVVADKARFAREENVEDDMDARARKTILAECVSKLREDERELFELRFVAELSYEDMAKILKKNEGTLRVGVNRLKNKLGKMIYEMEHDA